MEGQTDISNPELTRLLRPWQEGGGGYLALAGALRGLILDGRLPLRSRLPSERLLAAALQVSRTTTSSAYDVLRVEGYLESRRGSGSRIALPTGGTFDRELETEQTDATPARSGAIDLTLAAMPAPGSLMDAVGRASRELAGHLGGFGYDPMGLMGLRRAVADRFTQRGVPTIAEQIVVTSGAQQALRLLCDVLLLAGDPALIEVPTYPHAIEALRRTGARLVPLPVDREGWHGSVMEARFRAAAPRVAYLIPDFQNPTGSLMDDPQREQVLSAASRAGGHVIVDETFAELDLESGRAAPRPMAAHDDEGRVITIGSTSKAFWGGLRVGWIRCGPPLARRVARARASMDLASPVLEQLVAEHVLRGGAEVLAERRALLRVRRDALVDALRTRLPHWRFRTPRGGLSLWVELERPESEALADVAEQEGVRIVPGPRFGPDGTLEAFVRLPYTQPEDVLREAVERLAAAEHRLRLGARGREAGVVT